MKKLSLALIVILAALAIGFFVLLSGSGAENAPTEVSVIDLPDTYEK